MSTQQIGQDQIIGGGGGGASSLSVVTKTGNYVMTSTDDVVLANAVSGAIQITLLTPVGVTKPVKVKKIDSSANSVTVISASGTIEGGANAVMNVQYVSLDFVSDQTNYFIV